MLDVGSAAQYMIYLGTQSFLHGGKIALVIPDTTSTFKVVPEKVVPAATSIHSFTHSFIQHI